MRIRNQGNYKSFFTNSYRTIRLTNEPPLTPELEDVAINDKCLAGCSYCYTNALKTGNNFSNIIEKADEVWGSLPLNDRPFQIAIGGAGEPTMHPDFYDFVRFVKNLQILPNYTTNGMHLTDNVLKATKDHCGGVALSWHPHIAPVFNKAVPLLKKTTSNLNVHIIIGSEQSFIDLKEMYSKYKYIFKYFVLLPYQNVGRAPSMDTMQVWDKTFKWVESINSEKFAFGALFYDYISKSNTNLKMSIYNPDIYSGYRLLNNNYKTLYKSSYEIEPKNTIRY
jgi:hypothetical protein